MNRQSVSKAQKPNSLTFLPASGFLQRKTINRTDFGGSTVDTRSPTGQQDDKSCLPGAETHFSHDFTKIPIKLNSSYPIQAKLKIGQPDDKYEQEADRVAELVMRMPEPRLSASVGDSSLANSTIPRSGTIQRACASCSAEYKTAEDENRHVEPANLCPKCRTQEQGLIQTKYISPLIQRQESPMEEEEDEELIQAKISTGLMPEVTPAISSGMQALQGGGQPLSGSERRFFEPRFGADFSKVRVHKDTRAANVTHSVNARAFTHRHNVVFGAGEYSQDTLVGRKLLAHELTHVVQQNGGQPLFSAGKNSENTISNSQELSFISPELTARAINPKASAFGSHVAFGRGEHQSWATDSNQLLTHEPIHLMQQTRTGSRVLQREEASGGRTDLIEAPHRRLGPIRQARTDGEAALNRAIQRVTEAIDAHDRGEVLPTAVTDALARFFPRESPDFLDLLLRRMELVRNLIPHVPVRPIRRSDLRRLIAIDPEGIFHQESIRLNTPARVVPHTGRPEYIALYPAWYARSGLRTTRLVHEIFHYSFPSFIRGHPHSTRGDAFAYQGFVSVLGGLNIGTLVTRHYPEP